MSDFDSIKYNEMSLIRKLVEKRAMELIRSYGIKSRKTISRVPFNIWYDENRQRFKNLTTWQSACNELDILGCIYFRCEQYEKKCRKSLKQ